ncbi:initiation factor 2 [Glonium stellatum]|uniref:Translation initiation factor IF-2, mitochondrial n=1 Tax=Glonium stellatum TaxID=574774 RepID=A0A8E2ETV7_9PEZI|nr:initiation factor 2 [Glonium stellatum]
MYYRINLNSNSPPPSDIPTFSHQATSNWAHLKRKNEPKPRANVISQSQSQSKSSISDNSDIGDFLRGLERNPPPKPPPRRKLDSDAIQSLLSGASQRYVPLAKESGGSLRCFRCGGEGHRGRDCPNQINITRVSSRSSFEPLKEGQNNALPPSNNFDQSRTNDAPTPISPALYQDEEKRRAADSYKRRSGRLKYEDEDSAALSYELAFEPEHRKSSDRRKARRSNRIIRDIDEDEYDDEALRAERKRQRKAEKRKAQLERAEPTPIYLPEYISVTNLASMLKVRVEEFVRKMEQLGFEDVQNDHILNAENAGLIAMEYNFEPIIQAAEEDADLYAAPVPEDISSLPARPPVVTIMGHVDHGKTTILDYMRKSSVAATEFGGITQHIGAFSVPLASGKTITFLDTPGHAAFLSMRQRGANVTDIVILVVAADDSVKPQTIEAIKHAQSADVPIIVAINKIDKDEAAPDRVKQDLARNGVEVEDYGGDTQVVCVSGKTGQGMPELEEAVVTLSEILDHRAEIGGAVEGWVLEATTKKSGRVATILVRRGTLRVGDVLVAGTTWARVRTLKNEAGVAIKEVGPGMPVEVDGWREQPLAGDEVLQAPDEQKAAAVSELRLEKEERERMAKDMEAINETRRLETEKKEKEEAAAAAAAAASADGSKAAESVEEVKDAGPEVIPFIVKGDVSGSVEAVVNSIAPIGNAEVSCTILRSGVGSPSEFDVEHAATAKGHIINFNTVVPPNISSLAEEKGVRILDSNIIYRVVEDAKALLSEKLAPRIVSRVTGEAEVAQSFEIGLGGKKKLRIAGVKVRNGTVNRGGKVKVLRGDNVIYDGTVSSLKLVKKDVSEMRKGTECGMAFEGWEGFEVGDQAQCYEEKQEKRYL